MNFYKLVEGKKVELWPNRDLTPKPYLLPRRTDTFKKTLKPDWEFTFIVTDRESGKTLSSIYLEVPTSDIDFATNVIWHEIQRLS